MHKQKKAAALTSKVIIDSLYLLLLFACGLFMIGLLLPGIALTQNMLSWTLLGFFILLGCLKFHLGKSNNPQKRNKKDKTITLLPLIVILPITFFITRNFPLLIQMTIIAIVAAIYITLTQEHQAAN